MTEHQGLRRIAALGMVAMLMAVSLAMVFSPAEEVWPEGVLPAFESEAQLQSFLAHRNHERWGLIGLINEAAGDSSYRSETNVQVTGVDELDVVKTDGQLLYVSSAEGVSIISALDPGEMHTLSRINATDPTSEPGSLGTIVGLFLRDEVLVIVLNEYQANVAPHQGPEVRPTNDAWRERTLTTCALVDVSDPTSPIVITRSSMSGWYSAGRMIDEHTYLLSKEMIWLTGTAPLPITGVDGDLKEMEPTMVRFDPQSADPGNFVNILALNLETFQSNFTTLLVGYSSVIYVSAHNMYLTSITYTSSGGGLLVSASDTPTTNIFRLRLDGLNVSPEAKGTVAGFLYDQFSMDELNGVLRVATCTAWWGGENHVYTLDEDLRPIGSLTGIARGETIRSARFMGEVLYLVTFLNTDPLFVIDLSDPAVPAVQGELVVPGFSSYLHYCGQGLLAGIGLDNWTFKVSLYDVGDACSPTELQTLSGPNGSWSEALWDHKAVMYDPRFSWLMVPCTGYDREGGEPWLKVWVIQVHVEGLTTLAELDMSFTYGYTRCTVIGDVLYVTTSTQVVAWDMETFLEIGRIVHGTEERPWVEVADGGSSEDTVREER